MAGFANPRKNFRWALQFNGANQFLMQEVEVPEVKYPVLKHGAPVGIPDAKSPGKHEVGQMILKKIKPADDADLWAWDWFAQGLTGTKAQFMRNGFLIDYGTSGVAPVETFYCGQCWPSNIKDANRQSLSGNSENLIQTVTLEVQFFFPKESKVFNRLANGAAALLGGTPFNLGSSS